MYVYLSISLSAVYVLIYLSISATRDLSYGWLSTDVALYSCNNSLMSCDIQRVLHSTAYVGWIS